MKLITALLLIVSSYLIWTVAAADQQARVTILNIGQGDSILVETPSGTRILVDGGPDGTVVNELGQVLPWWTQTIDVLVVTHADTDHFAGLNAVLESYHIREVWYAEDVSTASAYQYFIRQLADRNITTRALYAGDEVRVDAASLVHVLWPLRGTTLERNARSLVLELAVNGIETLLTGDLPIEQEEEILQRGWLHDIDILKVGHHGSAGSSGEEFLSALRPELCLISAGLDNKFGHPKPEVLTRLAAVGCTIKITSELGRIVVPLSAGN